MKEIIILKYSRRSEFEEIIERFKAIDNLFPDIPVIALPADIDLFFDCSLEQLYNVRDIINKVICEKEKE